MATYIAQRLLATIPVVVLTSIVVFLLMRLLPGDPVLMIVYQAGTDVSNEAVQQMRRQYGLDQPIYRQYVAWLGKVLTGDLGRSIKHSDYVQAAHALGVPTRVVLGRHILPNVMNPVIVQASLGVGFAIIIESSLSFIGLGAQPPTPAWGSMVQTGFQYLETAPWFVLAPAAMIFLAVLGFNMLGDGLRDLLDPLTKSGR